jgi:hypothetical protein
MIGRIAALAALGATCLLADFSYEQTSRMSGGMMAGVMKIAGAFSKQAREPMRTSVLIKGQRMAQLSPQSAHIIDLDKETITEIDFQKRTYSVITFAEMADSLKQLDAKLKSEKGEEADISVKVSVKDTGQSKPILGLTARELVMTLEMEGTDQKSGQRGVFMVVTSDMWVAQHPAYNEVREFNQRMAQKLNWTPGSGMFAQGRSEIMRGMADLQKEASKLDGVPVYQVVKMGFQGEAAQAGQQPPAQPRAQQPAEEQEKPSVGGALGRLGGRFGGLGGLGRRKKPEPQAEPQPPAAETAPPPGGASGALMEVTTEVTSLSTAPLDPSKFEVPAGFKQVESPTVRALRR